ncbi:MAG: hypothetical protein AAGA90_04845 [Actinomycetota bacterium]
MDGRGGEATGPLRAARWHDSTPARAAMLVGGILLVAVIVFGTGGDDASTTEAMRAFAGGIDGTEPPDEVPADDAPAPEAAADPAEPADDDAPATDSTEPAVGDEPTTEPELPAVVGQFPPAPLLPRHAAAIVPLGDDVVVWGGHLEGGNLGETILPWASYVDGAVLDTVAGEWRWMAPAPLIDSSREPAAVAVGPVAVIARQRSIAAYDPSVDEWSPLPDLAFEVEQLFAVGDDMVAAVGWPNHVAFLSLAASSEWVAAELTGSSDNVAWTTDGDRVIASLSTPEGQQLEAFEPGASTSTVLGVSPDVRFSSSFHDVVAVDDRIVLVHESSPIWTFVESTGTWEDSTLLLGRTWETPPIAEVSPDGLLLVRKAPSLFQSSDPALRTGLVTTPLPGWLDRSTVLVGDRWWSFGYFVSEARNELVSTPIPTATTRVVSGPPPCADLPAATGGEPADDVAFGEAWPVRDDDVLISDGGSVYASADGEIRGLLLRAEFVGDVFVDGDGGVVYQDPTAIIRVGADRRITVLHQDDDLETGFPGILLGGTARIEGTWVAFGTQAGPDPYEVGEGDLVIVPFDDGPLRPVAQVIYESTGARAAFDGEHFVLAWGHVVDSWITGVSPAGMPVGFAWNRFEQQTAYEEVRVVVGVHGGRVARAEVDESGAMRVTAWDARTGEIVLPEIELPVGPDARNVSLFPLGDRLVVSAHTPGGPCTRIFEADGSFADLPLRGRATPSVDG